MNYKIYKDGEHINTIVADEEFVKVYCETNGYTYEFEVQEEPEPTTDDILNALLGVTTNE